MLDPFSKYQVASATTSGGSHQLIFVFDEIIKLLYRAKRAVAEKDYDLKYKTLSRATEVFYILKSGVDTEKNDEQAKINDFYYSTILALEKANMSAENSEDLDPILDGIKEVRNALKDSLPS